MLVRLIYASRAAAPMNAEELSTLMKGARSYNAHAGITGVLVYSDGIFLQLLEGGRDAINALYKRIVCDERHHHVTLLSYDELAERRFAGWAMGQANLSRLNPGILLKYCERAQLDPFGMSAGAVLALFDELVATAVIACPG